MTDNQTCPRCNWRLTDGACRERGCSESWELVFRERDEAREDVKRLRARLAEADDLLTKIEDDSDHQAYCAIGPDTACTCWMEPVRNFLMWSADY